MRYPHYEGVGKRIKERLLALGYRDEDGEPDIAAFINKHHYDPRSFYPWANKDRTPTGENLTRLVRDLKCSPAWLLFGEEPIPVGASSENPLPVAGRSRLKKNHTTRSLSARKDETLCQVRSGAVARALRHRAPTVARGIRRRAA